MQPQTGLFDKHVDKHLQFCVIPKQRQLKTKDVFSKWKSANPRCEMSVNSHFNSYGSVSQVLLQSRKTCAQALLCSLLALNVTPSRTFADRYSTASVPFCWVFSPNLQHIDAPNGSFTNVGISIEFDCYDPLDIASWVREHKLGISVTGWSPLCRVTHIMRSLGGKPGTPYGMIALKNDTRVTLSKTFHKSHSSSKCFFDEIQFLLPILNSNFNSTCKHGFYSNSS